MGVCDPHLAQLLDEDEVPLLELGRLPPLGAPREGDGASGPVGHHVALHQQLVVCR